jgi:hypothetical protein
MLDGVAVSAISSNLRPGADAGIGDGLPANRGRQYFGVVPTGNGFLLDDGEANELLGRPEADYSEIVRPYLVGDDITSSPNLRPTRWVIDFQERTLEEAHSWPAALEIVRDRVKPARDLHKKPREREQWWKFSRTVQEMFAALATLERFVACPAQAKRFFMVWCEPEWCPSNLTSVFAFADDPAMGVLASTIHTQWATTQSTRLETRPRYTSASFGTFPWPALDRESEVAIADIVRCLMLRRSELCFDRQIGLTTLYNEVDDGAYRDLAELHIALDEAVAAAYGWPASVAHDPTESNRRLLELNRAIAAGEVKYDPFGS